MSAVTARYPLSRNECSQRDDEKPACAARVRYHVRWNVWIDSDNDFRSRNSIKNDRAGRAIPEAESRADGESAMTISPPVPPVSEQLSVLKGKIECDTLTLKLDIRGRKAHLSATEIDSAWAEINLNRDREGERCHIKK